MPNSSSIFVQIPAYRDSECAPTLAHMFQQAKKPERIFAGVCWQFKPGEEADTPAVPDAHRARVRIAAFPVAESRGVCWARHQAATLYRQEDYILMIDCHTRFAKDWDEKLIHELSRCKSTKSVLSCHPAPYSLPANYDEHAPANVIRAHYPTAAGEIRLRGEPLDGRPKSPLNGAFATCSMLFSKGRLIQEVPVDPWLYFEQEEICLSARLYTHGWDVFHPTKHVLFHLYEGDAATLPRHKHWSDHPDWVAHNQAASERRAHLLGFQLATDEAALVELEQYGHGMARSLEQYADYCGIDFSSMQPGKRALQCDFIEGLSGYHKKPFDAGENIVKEQKSKLNNLHPDKEQKPRYIVSPFLGVPVERFKPASLDILRTPVYQPHYIPTRKGKEPVLVQDGVPPGVLVIENYASKELCSYLMEYSEKTLGTKLQVVDASQSTSNKVVAVDSENRRTEYVSINGISHEIISIFLDIYANRLAPFYGVKFEWFERPQILRYRVGGRYDPHADADDVDKDTGQWMRVQDRDISVLLYLNEDYEGGRISFESLNYSIQPKAGMLLAFPSDHRYLHAAKPTTAGIRYVIVSWSTYLGTNRIKLLPPYGSTIMHSPADGA